MKTAADRSSRIMIAEYSISNAHQQLCWLRTSGHCASGACPSAVSDRVDTGSPPTTALGIAPAQSHEWIGACELIKVRRAA